MVEQPIVVSANVTYTAALLLMNDLHTDISSYRMVVRIGDEDELRIIVPEDHKEWLIELHVINTWCRLERESQQRVINT